MQTFYMFDYIYISQLAYLRQLDDLAECFYETYFPLFPCTKRIFMMYLSICCIYIPIDDDYNYIYD